MTDRKAVEEQRPGMDVHALGELIRAVGFSMQPKIHPQLRAETERYLNAHLNGPGMRYFQRKRLASLALPGGIPKQLAFVRRSTTARRTVRKARAVRKAVRR